MPRLQPVPELNRIKLLKFPSLATEMIIKEMDFVDALQLSLSSSRCKRMTSWARNRTPVGKTDLKGNEMGFSFQHKKCSKHIRSMSTFFFFHISMPFESTST
ncbi:hypothetical protein L5515_015255 [Caenorhabditis briggsae]|uniref:F-box domain-containing protein n=1 Tax=Caenorhabditis briggsae TaxID=6238 RepID=A0AAE9EFM9_CAEBR|nr:hypothetical protein L5515_015255 [Caenorhabditis briggsae]